jgi:ATP-binding cassette subfamily F protein uup
MKQGLSYSEKKEFGLLEKEIAQLEKKKSAIEVQFAENSVAPGEIAALSHTLQELMKDIEKKENRWIELSMKSEI